jgi:hypothetical protein
MARIDTVNREPTPIQASAYGAADILLAGGPGIGPLVPTQTYMKRWQQVGNLKETKPGKDWAIALDVIDRLLVLPSGQKLVDDLIPLLKRPDAPAAKIQVHFMNRADFPEQGHDVAAGYFTPDTDGEPQYDVFIQWEKNLKPNDFAKFPLQNLKLGKSLMAHSLFHELLHVWFIHAFPGAGTGHTSEDRMDPAFKKRVDAVIKDLELIDKRP